MKRFVYLFQVEQDLPESLECAAGPDSDIVYLSWRTKSADPRSVHYPSSSWTQGRNRLFKEVCGRDYEYFVFADDDLILELTDVGAASAGAGADPWRVFERFLLEWEPAVGCVSYDWHLTGGVWDGAKECQTLRFFDALLNAFHHEALGCLLPYYDLLDGESETYAQSLLCSLAADLFPGHVMQTNHLRVLNTERRREYGEFALSKPENLYLEALRDPQRVRIFQRQPIAGAARHPTMGPPRAKTETFTFSEEQLATVYDLDHVLWSRRRELRELPVTDAFFSESDESARARRWRAKRKPRVTPPAPSRLDGLRSHPLLRYMFRRSGRVGVWIRWMTALFKRVVQLVAARDVAPFVRAFHRWRGYGRARPIWRAWAAQPDMFYEIPEGRHRELLFLLGAALNQVNQERVVFIDVGAGPGDILQGLRQGRLKKPIFSIGIDPVDLRGHRAYSGFVIAAIKSGVEEPRDFYQYSSLDCSSLKRMDTSKVTHDPRERGAEGRYFNAKVIERLEEVLRVPTFNLSTIVRNYGLEDEVLHFVKIDAQGSDLDVFRSLGALAANCLFLQIETVYSELPASEVALYEGQTTFPEDRALIEAAGFRLFNVKRFGATPEADVLFVNTRLFRTTCPALAG